MPSMETFRTLLAVVDTGSATAAAKQLDCDLSLATRRLKEFQRRGDAWLNRSGKTWSLTAAGQAALPAVRQLVRQYDQVVDHLDRKRSAPQIVYIGAGSFSAGYYLPAAVMDFRARLPRWQVDVRVLRGRERIAEVVEGKLDLAIVSHSPAQVDAIANAKASQAAAIRVEQLASHPVCLAALKGSPVGKELATLPADRAVPLERLGDWDLIGPDRDSGVRSQLEERMITTGRRMDFVVEGGGWHVARRFAHRGVGVAILPIVALASDDYKPLVIRRLPESVQVKQYVISRDIADHEGRATFRAILKVVTKSLSEP